MRAAFAVEPGAEISIEANPGTLTAAKAADFKALGVNRVSLGVQSLDDALLARIGRRHTRRDALAAFELLRAAGFDNLGIDLIHGLPGQSPAIWRRDLARAIDLGPEHLSLYALGIEAGTPFAADLAAGRLELPGEHEELEMLALARELTARAGYERYEISNFARPGRRCRHNLDCWNLGEYRGFGAGAHSFLRSPAPLRLANTPDIDDYVRRIAAGGDAVAMREEPSPRQFAGEALMLGLRTADGVDETAFARDARRAARGALPGGRGPRRREGLARALRRTPAPHRGGDPLLERNLPPALLTRGACTERHAAGEGVARRGGLHRRNE